jgi:hypothetical protein
MKKEKSEDSPAEDPEVKIKKERKNAAAKVHSGKQQLAAASVIVSIKIKINHNQNILIFTLIVLYCPHGDDPVCGIDLYCVSLRCYRGALMQRFD